MLTNRSDQRFAYLILIATSVLFILNAWIFLSYPELDLIIHRWFYSADTGFVMKQYSSIEFARKFVMFFYGLWYAYIVVGIFASTHSDPWRIYKKAAFTTRQWIYLVACSVLGPLVLSNFDIEEQLG